MENNDISASQVRRVCKMDNNNNKCDSKSSISRMLQDDYFIPFEKTDPNAFINVLEEGTTYHVIDDDDDNE